MDNQNTEAHDLIVKAREALRRGDKETAHNQAEQAALLSPGMEDAWLILTASDPNPEDSLAYAQQALEINPSSERALRAVEWAIARLKKAQTLPETAAAGAVVPVPTEQEKPPESKKSNSQLWIAVGAVLVLLLCAALAFMVYQGITSPTLKSILSNSFENKVTESSQEKHWASMSLPKPSGAPPIQTDGTSPQVVVTPTTAPIQDRPTNIPTELPAFLPTVGAPASTPSEIPTEAATATSQASSALQTPDTPQTSGTPLTADVSQATETPVVMSMEMMADVPVNQPATSPSSPSSAPQPQAASYGSGAHWIDVDLTNQMVYAYAGDALVNSFVVSTGTWLTPTVTGQYHIYVKYRSAPMSGPGYYLPDVPYIMYFYKGYGLHGTYWHNNFGTPMSHGCVNLRTDEAAWLYSWASVGTLVNIHY
jgi:lipoprotein-anchoring transpeptidase ErfK/SrfK